MCMCLWLYFSSFDCCIYIIHWSRLNLTKDLYQQDIITYSLQSSYSFISRINTVIVLSPRWLNELSINKQLMRKLKCSSISFNSHLQRLHWVTVGLDIVFVSSCILMILRFLYYRTRIIPNLLNTLFSYCNSLTNNNSIFIISMLFDPIPNCISKHYKYSLHHIQTCCLDHLLYFLLQLHSQTR